MNVSPVSVPKGEEVAKAWFGGRIPIVLGSVGHRDLTASNAAAVTRSIARECRRLRRLYKHSPFLLLSGLAEGADRIVTKIAVKELGAKLIAVLPFPVEEFQRDFRTDASRQEFKQLLDSAAAMFQVPLPPGDEWKRSGTARDRQYAKVGALIAEQSQVLLALWDGHPPRGPGGTAEVVAWFERGYAPREYSVYEGDLLLFDPPEPGMCIRFNPTTGARQYRNMPPTRRRFGLSDRITIGQILSRTETYNWDVARQAAYYVPKAALVPPEILAQAPLSEAFDACREADALALYYGRRLRRSDWVLYALALVAVFAFNLVDNKPIASWGFLGTVLLTGLVAFYVWSRELDSKSLEYRTFAEAMRILFFWRMVGLDRQVWLSYLSKHGTVVRWLRHAVRAVEFTQDRRAIATATLLTSQEPLTTLRQYWLWSQINYFKRAEARHMRHHWRGMWIARLAIICTFASAIILAVMTFNYADGWHEWRNDAMVSGPFGGTISVNDFIQQLQVAISLLASLGVASRAFLLRTADLDLAKQYAAIREKFEVAETALAAVNPGKIDVEGPPILERLGREALLEHAEWLWLRHSRPFEPPG